MPKTNIDYSKTIIYKIINYDYPELVYVGSTTNFTKRKQHHKDAVFNQNSLRHNLKIYKIIRENGNWESWNMIKICDYPCYDKREAELEEDRHMMELKSNLNMRRASRSMKQYYEDNKENIKDKKKQYYEDNKENIKDKFKQYYEDNKDKFKEYREDNKDKIKQYREDNKDKIKENLKKYYDDNKDQINANKSKKCTCECGSPFTRENKSQHIKTMKHQKYVNTIEHINGVV
jgi:hypothetical protein